ILAGDVPLTRRLVVHGGGDTAAELDVTPEGQLVRDEVVVPQRLRLGGEVLAPLPFCQNLLREGVPVRPRLGVEPRAGIAVPVPGAAHAVAGFEHPYAKPEIAQAVQLIHSGHPGADHDDVEVRAHRRLPCSRRPSYAAGRPALPRTIDFIRRIRPCARIWSSAVASPISSCRIIAGARCGFP